MQQLAQQVVAGLATGAIFGSLALALVLIYTTTGIVNFAQGEMGMFATFVAWSLITNHGFSYWPAFALTLVLAFAGGVAVQRVVIRPLERAPALTVVMVSFGPSSASPRSGSLFERLRSRRRRAACSVFASAGCSRSAGGSRPS